MCVGCPGEKKDAGRPIRLVIQAKTDVVEATYGEVTQTWTTAATIRGTIKWRDLLSAGEKVRAMQIDASRLGTLRFRYRAFAGLTPSHRLMHGSRVLKILSCYDEGERNQWWVCTVYEDADPEE